MAFKVTKDANVTECRKILSHLEDFLNLTETEKDERFQEISEMLVKVLKRGLVRASNELGVELRDLMKLETGSNIPADGDPEMSPRWSRLPETDPDTYRFPMIDRKVLL